VRFGEGLGGLEPPRSWDLGKNSVENTPSRGRGELPLFEAGFPSGLLVG